VSALVAGVALLAAGCGSSTLSAGQLRHRAGRICATAQQRSEAIPAPSHPEQGARFLARGVAALGPAVTALHALKPPDDLAGDYAAALRATDRELQALRSARRGLAAGNDPVVAIRTLQHDLDPAEDAAASAWHAVGVPACTSVMG
jgi:hypothetical protein